MRVLRLTLCLSLLLCLSAFANAQTQIQGPRDNTQVYSGVVYGPIDQNDTLWRIASRYKQDSQFSVYQVMLAIYELNPQAFENGNFNTMVNGATLQLPSDRYIARTNLERAREKAVQDDRAFGRQNSVRDPVVGTEPSSDIDAASNLKPEVPLVNQQDLSNTQRQLQGQLDALKRQQRDQIAMLREQVATSLENVEVLLDENRQLNERLLQIDDNNRVLTQTVETELQTQIDQQVAQLNQLIALMKENEQRRIEESSGSLMSFLKSNTGIMIISITVVLLVLILFGILILRKPVPASNQSTGETENLSSKTPDIVDDELVIGELDEAADSQDSDDLMAALADDDALQVDDILSDELEDEDALSTLSDDILDDDLLTADMLDADLADENELETQGEENAIDDFEVDLSSDFDDLDDDMLVPDIKKADSDEDSIVEDDDAFGISLDKDADGGDKNEDLLDANDDENNEDLATALDETPETNAESDPDINAQSLESDSVLDDKNSEDDTEGNQTQEPESTIDEALKLNEEQPENADSDLPEGISLDENGEISSETIDQIEKQIEEKHENINRLADELLDDLGETISNDDIDEIPEQVSTINEDISNEIIAELAEENEITEQLGEPEGSTSTDLADEILDDLTGQVEEEDELDALLAEFDIEDESNKDEVDLQSDNTAPSDDLLDDIPSFTASDELSDESLSEDLETEISGSASVTGIDDLSELNASDSGTQNKEDDEDVLSALPDLDNWLDEEDTTSDLASEQDLTSELDDANFDDMLEELSSETSTSDSSEDDLLSDLDIAGLDIDALMSDDLTEKADGTNEGNEHDFVDVDELLRESESLPQMTDDDIELDIEKSLDQLVDNSSGGTINLDEAGLDETDIDQAGNLDLAQVYIDMEDQEAARELLDEVVVKGTPDQQKEASDLLDDLNKR